MPLGALPGRSFGLPAVIALSVALTLSGCGSANFADVGASVGSAFSSPAKGTPLPVTMFIASTRRDDQRIADTVVDGGVHHSIEIVTLPPGHRPGVIETPAFGKRAPSQHFFVGSQRALSPSRFTDEIATHLSGRIGVNRDVLVYVHGFNTSLDEARFRLAQIVADARFGGVPVLFTWPSQANLFSYESDKEGATASRDALEQLLQDISNIPDLGRVHILAHSMGSWLAMEAMRENAIAGRPDLGGRLGDIMLAAPDIDLAVFRQQLARLGSSAHVSIFTSHDDKALSISSRIAGDRPRLGALNPSDPRERAVLESLGVRVYDVSRFSTDFIGHGAYADSAPVIQTIGAQLAEPRKEDMKPGAGADPAAVAAAPVPASTPAETPAATSAATAVTAMSGTAVVSSPLPDAPPVQH